MKRAWIMTIAALCAACSSDPDIQPVPPSEVLPTESEKPGNESGSRLRKIERVGADGSREFAGWYDSERDEDCAFRKIDSVARCLPQMHQSSDRNYEPYADAACTRPLGGKTRDAGAGRGGNPLREYTLIFGSVFPDNQTRMYVHGDVSAAGSVPQPEMAQVYVLTVTQGCVPLRPLDITSAVFLEEISFDSFVSWTEVVDGLGN